jgi:hypothetical protein
MKITMLDTVETAHTIVNELEDDKITDQPGLRILSQADGRWGGLTGRHYVLNIRKGATVALPKRLCTRLVGIGFAKAVWAK